MSGGRPHGVESGWFVEPTAFADIDNRSTIAREEIFGLALSIIPYGDEDEAIRLASASSFGLGGTVWTKDHGRGVALARRIQTGSVGINTYLPACAQRAWLSAGIVRSKEGGGMALAFQGVLADRRTWSLDTCSIGLSMEAVGTRSSMLILREAFYGTTRFDDFARRTKLTDAIVAARLKELTKLGLFTKELYQEPGKRRRAEYLLTEMGRDLVPVVFALMQWGDKHLQGESGGPLLLVERSTGEPVKVSLRTASGEALDLEDVAIVTNGPRPLSPSDS